MKDRFWKIIGERAARMKREWRVIYTFPTTTDAIYMEHVCKMNSLPGRMIPTPTQITAGCGLAWSAPIEERERLSREAESSGIRIDGIYRLEL
jgi:hypothetical protein